MMMRARPILAIVFRHAMTLRRPGWFFETIYGTTLDVFVFGLLGTSFLLMGSTDAQNLNALITNIALWYVVVRGAATMGTALRIELDERNLLAVVTTGRGPLTWLVAGCVLALAGALVAFIAAIAAVAVVFGYNILSVGWALVAAGVALAMASWVVGLCVLCLVLLLGRRSIGWAHAVCWMFVPISNVYCQLSSMTVLPWFVRQVPNYVPMAPAFDGLRAAIINGASVAPYVARSCALSCLWIVVLGALFCLLWRRVQKDGLARLEIDW